MTYHEIKIETTAEGTEIVAAALSEIGIEAIEIIDGQLPEPGTWDYIDDALIQTPKDEAFIRIYLEDNYDYPLLIESIQSTVKSLPKEKMGSLTITESLHDDSEWKDKWKDYFKPFRAGERVIICPLWETYEATSDDIVVTIDPGAAFGSGLHETTQMCIQQLEKYVSPDKTVFDVGCGSGILAITAAKLGANDIIAADYDDLSVVSATENCNSNKVTDEITIFKSDLLSSLDNQKANIIVANIVADIIIRLNKSVKQYLKPDGIYIMSGIIAERLDDVITSLTEQNFNIINIQQMGEWRAITATSK